MFCVAHDPLVVGARTHALYLQVVPGKGSTATMDVDGPAAQRESELGCVSGELSEWTASDHRIQDLTDRVDGGSQQQQQQAVQDG
jgi:hypothetical protein